MLNRLGAQLRNLTRPGETVICAVSGGADSMALLWGAYLLKDTLGIRLEAAHFNHHLRSAESDRDEAFVREFCSRFEIPLTVGAGAVIAGEKGLEAAARDTRYAFLRSLPGKIATAHTADDNAETLLMHLVRGTGLKGLGGIAPVSGELIRPMLTVTRQQVEEFLAEYHIPHIEDSSNATDTFLRNRLRHHVMPLLKAENPRLAENLSAMALRLRQDEEALAQMAAGPLPDVETLRAYPPAVRNRTMERFLKESGVKEPEAQHIALAESLVFSDKPSAKADFPGGVTVSRNYDRLEVLPREICPETVALPEKGTLEWCGLRITVESAEEIVNTPSVFTVSAKGTAILRSRQPGDELRLSGGTKSLKKLFIDRKIPAARRPQIPVIADAEGVLGAYGIGVNLDRAAEKLPAMRIRFEPLEKE